MKLEHSRFADVVVLAPLGRVDHTTAEAFRAAVAPHLTRCAKDQDHVVLDLAGVDYISSAGLRVLLVAARRVQATGGRLALCGMGQPVRQVFQLAGFLPLFTIQDTRDAAVDQIAAP